MFGLKRKNESQAVVVLPQKPIALAPHKGVVPLESYENLAKELDFMPAQLLEEQLRRFLAECGIPVYSYADVDKYLTLMAEKERKYWIWRPLREQDKPKWVIDGHNADRSTNSAWDGHGSYQNDWKYRPYSKAVPIHILRNVKKIQDHFQSHVNFFVSDYAVPNPDPFIMVTALDVSRIVFGVWDEPAFEASAE